MQCLQSFSTNPAKLSNGRKRYSTSNSPPSSRTNADDRLPRVSEVALKVATASSRAETLPMFVRRPIPHALDDLTQLGTIGIDNEVDRQTVGPNDTSVPPALIRPADRFWMSAPMTGLGLSAPTTITSAADKY